MRLELSVVLLAGCQLVWAPDDYRGGPVDSGVDASDADMPDSFADTPMVDVGVDAAPECLAGTTVGPITLGGLDGRLTLRSTRVDYDGTGAAITIAGPGVVLENVLIVLTGEAHGIVLDDAADDAMISNVRVRYEGPPLPTSDPFTHQVGLLVRGSNLEEGAVRDLTIRGLVVEGIEGIRLEAVSAATIVGVRILDPVGRANRDGTDRYAGLAVLRSQDVEIDDFTVQGAASPMGLIDHAVHTHEVSGCMFTNGYVSAPSSRYAMRLEGESTRPNTMADVDVHQSREGIEVVDDARWTLTTVEVARRSDCDLGDYAFANRTVAGLTCIDCFETPGDCIHEQPGLATTLRVDGDGITPLLPIDFCF